MASDGLCEWCHKRPKYRQYAHCGLTCATAAGVKQTPNNTPNAQHTTKNKPEKDPGPSLGYLLSREIKTARKARDAADKPEFFTQFLTKGHWTIADNANESAVVLTRCHKDSEDIRVTFFMDIGDDDEEDEQDEQLENDNDGHSDNKHLDDIDDEEEEVAIDYFVSITKAHKGSLLITGAASDEHLSVENISYTMDTKLATDDTNQAEWARGKLYPGPLFEELNESMQKAFKKYLKERGIGHPLASFITKYVEHKEKKERAKWFEAVKLIVDD